MGDSNEQAKQAEAEDELAESAESEQAEAPPEGAEEGAPEAVDADDQVESGDEGGDQPKIDPDEQATVPGDLDLDPEAIEDESAEEDAEQTDDEEAETGAQSEGSTTADAMGSDAPDPTLKAGELYVTVVKSATNSAIRSRGGNELDRDHFEEYDLAGHFNATMDQMGVGSDLEPHEALLLSTALAVGEGFVTETDLLDQQIDRLMDKAVNGEGGAAA